jgi:hypothetical protein
LEKMHLKLVTISAWRKKVLGNGWRFSGQHDWFLKLLFEETVVRQGFSHTQVL